MLCDRHARASGDESDGGGDIKECGAGTAGATGVNDVFGGIDGDGRAAPEKAYVARNGNRGREYPIVVLVNRYSASAAEIVSGALQDHDRGLILGETTFGKGLVQTVYPLSEQTGLALTWAHFYTPSGRLIQRDYSNISFLDYYTHSNLEQKNMADVKMTDSGRTVYGGGGITPDEKFELAKLNTDENPAISGPLGLFGHAKKCGSHRVAPFIELRLVGTRRPRAA